MGTIKRWAAAKQPRGVKPPQLDIMGQKRVVPAAPWLAQFPQRCWTEPTNKNLKHLETSVPKNVTEGERVASTYDVVIDVFSSLQVFEQRCYCPASVCRISWASYTGQWNSGILSWYTLLSAVYKVSVSAKWLAGNNFNICVKLYC
jgi:hypothetical protein